MDSPVSGVKTPCLRCVAIGFQNASQLGFSLFWLLGSIGLSLGCLCLRIRRPPVVKPQEIINCWTAMEVPDPSVWMSVCSQHAGASRGPGLREPVPGKGGRSGSVGLCGCWPGGQLVAAGP